MHHIIHFTTFSKILRYLNVLWYLLELMMLTCRRPLRHCDFGSGSQIWGQVGYERLGSQPIHVSTHKYLAGLLSMIWSRIQLISFTYMEIEIWIFRIGLELLIRYKNSKSHELCRINCKWLCNTTARCKFNKM